MLGEQKQQVIADGVEVPVIGAPFLRPMHRALTRIHVEHDPVGARRHLGLCEDYPVHSPQPDEIRFLGQQLCLEPMQRRCQRGTPVPELWRPDETKCRVRRHAHRVVEVFGAREATVDRLPREIRQAELRVHPLSGVAQELGDECRQPQAFIQLAHQNETGVGGDARSVKRDLQKAIERELKRLGLHFTHRVLPSLARFLASELRKSRRADVYWPYGTTAKSEIRSNIMPARLIRPRESVDRPAGIRPHEC